MMRNMIILAGLTAIAFNYEPSNQQIENVIIAVWESAKNIAAAAFT